jgi:NADP-dependent 3-hydroxy acid dehydrogenase YdfG
VLAYGYKRRVNVLEDTVALVTGASSGIGEATALTLANGGVRVAIAARRRERLDALAARIRNAGGEVFVVEADLMKGDEATATVQRTVDQFGRLDILINNAGLMLLGPAVDASIEEWDRMLDVNLRALMHCAHAALPHLQRAAEDSPRGVADMVNVSSIAGRFARANSAAYAATKFGVGALSEALRQEFTRKHVRVSLVEPGYVVTELLSHNPPDIIEGVSSMLAGPEDALQSEDIADAIAYIVTRPRHVAINEVLIRPTVQER